MGNDDGMMFAALEVMAAESHLRAVREVCTWAAREIDDFREENRWLRELEARAQNLSERVTTFTRAFGGHSHTTDMEFANVRFKQIAAQAAGGEMRPRDMNETTREYAEACVVEIAKLEAENRRLREALMPSTDTKAAYIGEFTQKPCHVGEEPVVISWTAIKEIMAGIRARAANAAGGE